ncbi:Cytochrome P450 52A12 [Colletotrichum tanaceti]|uniref:Cytochrome P450 52A12 n=1 Tax=Colletotrichum tanaceti TaxID=1306861 RepID=A0A4U6X0Y3_9PEZI|nr:Cytochrome P450 52A12 [Colletotrichum tanaceti]
MNTNSWAVYRYTIYQRPPWRSRQRESLAEPNYDVRLAVSYESWLACGRLVLAGENTRGRNVEFSEYLLDGWMYIVHRALYVISCTVYTYGMRGNGMQCNEMRAEDGKNVVTSARQKQKHTHTTGTVYIVLVHSQRDVRDRETFKVPGPLGRFPSPPPSDVCLTSTVSPPPEDVGSLKGGEPFCYKTSHSIEQNRTEQNSTPQHSTAQHSKTQHSTAHKHEQNMAREYLYLVSSAVLGTYILWTAAETYVRWSRGSHLTPSHAHAHAHPVLALLLALPATILYGKARYVLQMKARGCGEAPVFPHTDPVFGSDWVRTSLARQRDHGLLEWWQGLFARLGNTWWYRTPTGWWLMTSEPENIKTMLASSFDDFPIAGPRRTSVLPILGPEAIFAANGEAWHGARAMMRPTFVRDQIADLECFERHVGNLIARIPRDGGTVDLQSLLFMMTMDSATDFM